MKRYRFRLAQVQRVRRVQEELAAAALAEARREEAAAAAVVTARRGGLAERRAVAGAWSSTGLAAHAALVSIGHRDLDDRLQALGLAEDASGAARATWAAAAARSRALDLLDERRRAEHAVEAGREEAARIDDLVAGRHARRTAS